MCNLYVYLYRPMRTRMCVCTRKCVVIVKGGDQVHIGQLMICDMMFVEVYIVSELVGDCSGLGCISRS